MWLSGSRLMAPQSKEREQAAVWSVSCKICKQHLLFFLVVSIFCPFFLLYYRRRYSSMSNTSQVHSLRWIATQVNITTFNSSSQWHTNMFPIFSENICKVPTQRFTVLDAMNFTPSLLCLSRNFKRNSDVCIDSEIYSSRCSELHKLFTKCLFRPYLLCVSTQVHSSRCIETFFKKKNRKHVRKYISTSRF